MSIDTILKMFPGISIMAALLLLWVLAPGYTPAGIEKPSSAVERSLDAPNHPRAIGSLGVR